MSAPTLADLARRVARLEDAEAIKALKARYCAACDRGYDADAIASMYAEDGIWDGGRTFGRKVGREAIRKHFQGAAGRISIARHQVMNPDVRVSEDGSEAEGEWLLFQPCTDSEAGAAWLAATYHDRYVKVAGKWLFKETVIDVAFYTPYKEGWGEKRFIPGREPEGFVGKM
ncbi:hypothetical protein DFJ74DRAFT_766063 [Hyaloraphidium curvatum]|nr:hypothetical protein DFJ74DRAFT_766063 [Hyaloraphidium curvatum]